MVKLSRFLPKTEKAVHRCSIKVLLWRVLNNSQETICKSLFFSSVAGLLLIKKNLKSLLYRCFPVNFAKYFTALFSQSTSGWLLLLHILLFAESTLFPKCYVHEAISGVTRQLVVTELIYRWQRKRYVKYVAENLHKYSKKVSVTESLLSKTVSIHTVSPQTYNYTSKETITGGFLWIYLCQNIFLLLHFTQVCVHICTTK